MMIIAIKVSNEDGRLILDAAKADQFRGTWINMSICHDSGYTTTQIDADVVMDMDEQTWNEMTG